MDDSLAKILLLCILCINTCDSCDCRKVEMRDDIHEIRKILEENAEKTLDRCECRVDNTVRDNEPTQH